MQSSTPAKSRVIHPRAVARLFWSYLKRHPALFAVGILGVTVTQLGNLLAPWFLRELLNTLVTATPSPEVMQHLVLTVAAVGGAWLVSWVGMRAEYISHTFLQTRIMADLIADSFRYLLGHSHHFFTSNFAGSLTHKVNRVARTFMVVQDSFTLQFFPAFLVVGGAIIVLSLQHLVLGLALAVWSAIFIAVQMYLSNRLRPIRNARAEAETRITASLADSIGNHTTSQLFSGIGYEHQLLKNVTGAWRKATVRSWLADHNVWAVLGLLMLIIQVGLLYLATNLWSQGLLTVGDFILIQSYLLMIFERLVAINREMRRFYDAIADASETIEILDIPHEVKDVGNAKTLEITGARIDFKNVDFHFHKEAAVFKDFNLTISGGEKVALVGPSGAGKSTITKLLLRLYDIQAGFIEIDGQNIAHVTQDSLRDAIAFVPQEPILFHRTLMENIRYSKRDASDEEVVGAAKKAHCHEFISSLPEKYNTYVGERGVKLSGGERQRVAIARAILKDAPILILDEATSSLDSESEALIQDALTTLMEGKTVLVIAHRLSTIMKMDRILVLEGGAIVAEGTHQELINQGGLYQKLWNIQAGGFIGEDVEREEE